MEIYLQTSSPKAYLTGAMAVKNSATCSSYASLNLWLRFLFGASSLFSFKINNLSIGMLKCFNALSCYSLLGKFNKM